MNLLESQSSDIKKGKCERKGIRHIFVKILTGRYKRLGNNYDKILNFHFENDT